MMKDAGQRSMMWKGESAMGVYTHNPRRDVNKYMHKREIDARFREMGGREGER
jgi:hypothetical protein